MSILTSKGVLFAEEWPLGHNMTLDILNSVKWWDCSLISTLFKNPVGRMAAHRTLHTWISLGINFKRSSQVYFLRFIFFFKDESGNGDLELYLQKCFLFAFAPKHLIQKQDGFIQSTVPGPFFFFPLYHDVCSYKGHCRKACCYHAYKCSAGERQMPEEAWVQSESCFC